MNKSQILKDIHRLSGIDYENVFEHLQNASETFRKLDQCAHGFFSESSDEELSRGLSPNRIIYTETRPVEESIFLYFDLSTSIELMNYVNRLRKEIREFSNRSNGFSIRFSDLRFQHATAFGDMIDTDLGVNANLLETVHSVYRSIIQELLPFNLTITGPHISKTGGIILEGIVYSEQLYRLRRFASENDSHVLNSAKRGIHQIVHSTVGYVTIAKQQQLIELYGILKSMREKDVRIPIRIRDGRITTAKNKKIVGKPIIIPFGGMRYEKLPKKQVFDILQRIRNYAQVWMREDALKNLVWEEAIYWVESGSCQSIQRLASEIMILCKGNQLRTYPETVI